MKLAKKTKQKLLANWGEKASSMACMAEVRIYDPLSPWQCYIYAMNPEDENEILCIIKGHEVEVCEWKMSELEIAFNSDGEPPLIDDEYRPILASEVYKKLMETNR